MLVLQTMLEIGVLSLECLFSTFLRNILTGIKLTTVKQLASYRPTTKHPKNDLMLILNSKGELKRQSVLLTVQEHVFFYRVMMWVLSTGQEFTTTLLSRKRLPWS